MVLSIMPRVRNTILEITDNEFISNISCKDSNSNDSKLNHCPRHFKDLFKNLNNVNSTINCKYFNVHEMKHNKDFSSYMHLNIAPLPYHIDDLRNLITCN